MLCSTQLTPMPTKSEKAHGLPLLRTFSRFRALCWMRAVMRRLLLLCSMMLHRIRVGIHVWTMCVANLGTESLE